MTAPKGNAFGLRHGHRTHTSPTYYSRWYPYIVQRSWGKGQWGGHSVHSTESGARLAMKYAVTKWPMSNWRIVRRTREEVVASWPR